MKKNEVVAFFIGFLLGVLIAVIFLIPTPAKADCLSRVVQKWADPVWNDSPPVPPIGDPPFYTQGTKENYDHAVALYNANSHRLRDEMIYRDQQSLCHHNHFYDYHIPTDHTVTITGKIYYDGSIQADIH